MRGCNWLELDIVLPNEVIAHFWQHAGLIAGTKEKKGMEFVVYGGYVVFIDP